MKVYCPECDAAVRVPSDHPDGKKVRCPDCDYAFRPRPDDDAPVRSRRSRDDDDYDRPRRSRGKKKQAANNNAALIAIPIVLVVLLGVGGAIAYFGFIKKKDDPFADDPGVAVNVPPAGNPAGRVPGGAPPVPPDLGGGGGVAAAPKAAPTGKVGFNIGDTAPEIEGDDIDGQVFKLSDYRGKVVMLDFWGHW